MHSIRFQKIAKEKALTKFGQGFSLNTNKSINLLLVSLAHGVGCAEADEQQGAAAKWCLCILVGV